MRTRTVLTAVLLAFVAAAVAAVILRGRPEPPTEPTTADAPADGVVAYYLHGTARCTTCRTLEAYSAEALAGSGVPMLVVNVDEPANQHFVQDFELTTKALVLVEYRGGEVVRWRNLRLIWDLVGEHDGFLTYVRDELDAFRAA